MDLFEIFGMLVIGIAKAAWYVVKAMGKVGVWLWEVIDPLNRRGREREEAIREAELRGRCECEKDMRVREEEVRIRENMVRIIEEKKQGREENAQKRRRDAIFASTKKAQKFIEDGKDMNGYMEPAVRCFAEDYYPKNYKVIEILSKEIKCPKTPFRRREEARSMRANLIREIRKAYNQSKWRRTH